MTDQPFKIADYSPADPVPDVECSGCGFAGYLHRETIRERVAGVEVEGTFLVCDACHGRHPDTL